MNTKHSVILLSGLLLVMMGIAWAQGPGTPPPTCPALEDEFLQYTMAPSAWARADWNAQTSRWEIDCKGFDTGANFRMPSNAATPSLLNTKPVANTPSRTPRRRSNSNVNTKP